MNSGAGLIVAGANPLPAALALALAALVVVAGLYDIRFRRIPNWLVLAGLAAGFGGHGVIEGWGGLRTAALGFGLACLIYLPLYLLRGMGGGDVKLMAAVGSLAGAMLWLWIFIFTAILGGVCAIALALWKGRLAQTLRNVGFIATEIARGRAPHERREDLDVKNPEALRLPHGAVIALGTLAVLTLMGAS